MDIHAHPPYLAEWSPGKTRSRWDYDSPDHLIADMRIAGERYFARCTHLLRAGDIIYVTDAAKARATIIVNWVDAGLNQVGWDIDTLHHEDVVVAQGASLTLRNRGGRGGLWCVLDAAGNILSRDHRTREEAERVLLNIAERQQVAA